MTFAGKTVVITGATRGIGKAIGLRLAREGATIVIAAKSVEENPKLGGTIYTAATEMEAAGGKALAIPCDIRFEEQIQQVVDKAVATFGGIDILINNAGVSAWSGVEETNFKVYQDVMELNFYSVVKLTQSILPSMISRKSGQVVSVSSLLGKFAIVKLYGPTANLSLTYK